tara:strand:+ start:208 stop:519 length:312 start_codon:yes stop_codon:yes gene_type:complete
MILHKKTSPESIIEAISNVSGYSVSELKGPARDAALCQWRHVGMFAARQKGFTLVEVGKLFNRHFSTVIMAEKKVDQYKNTISDSLEAVEQHVKRYEDSRGTT